MDGAAILDIKSSLQNFGMVADDAALEKMLEVAHALDLDGDSVVDEWIAYQSTHGCPLNKVNVEKLLKEKSYHSNRRTNRTPLSSKKRINSTENQKSVMNMEDDAILNAYRTQTPIDISEVKTPYSAVTKKPSSSPKSRYSSASFSPSTQLSENYRSRDKPGAVVENFGPNSKGISQYRRKHNTVTMELKNRMSLPFKYMFQKMADLADLMDDRIETVSEDIRAKYRDEIGEIQPCTMLSQEPIFITGRICCDQGGGVGRLNAKSVLLQGSKYISEGRCMSIDLSQTQEYSLFPGQIVVLLGNNPSGQKFFASKVFSSTCMPVEVKSHELLQDPFSVLVAAGPFTTMDCLSYEPLNDLITLVERRQPDVTIIIGPLADMSHKEMDPVKLSTSYDDVLQERIDFIVDSLQSSTSLVFVPSLRDAGCHPVFPQPPYSEVLPSKHNHFVQDPSIIKIHGVEIAMTSTDILFHLSAEEISKTTGASDRIGRIVQHILQQKSFYPLFPSSRKANIDLVAADRYGTFAEGLPDILILPSDLKFFVKRFDGCVCVNPGRIAKGKTGGTFAQILIEPPGTGEDKSMKVSAQVEKI